MTQWGTAAILTALFAGMTAACVGVPPVGAADVRPGPTQGLSLGETTWVVKAAKNRLGPGPNFFSRKNVSPAGPELPLSIEGADLGGGRTRWLCAEVYSREEFGSGVFEIDFRRSGAFDAQAVFGFFLYNDQYPPWFGEADIELSFWGNRERPELSFTVQGEGPLNTRQISRAMPEGAGEYTARIEWTRKGLHFSVNTREGSPVADWAWQPAAAAAKSSGGEEPKRRRVHLNLWLYEGRAPAGDGALSVVISDF